MKMPNTEVDDRALEVGQRPDQEPYIRQVDDQSLPAGEVLTLQMGARQQDGPTRIFVP